LFLFGRIARPNALVVSVDVDYSREYRRAFPHLLQPGQRLCSIRGDSHDAETVKRVQRALRGKPLDFLFIDGDHSLEGVANDYRMYAPLVRPRGLVAFHDIVPDATTRFGIRTAAFAGGVPVFWERIKREHAEVYEFCDDPEHQDGYGIGLLRLP
jgi:cephalosporin hydroxylase